MNNLANILRRSGVVGAGGAGFPAYAKLSPETKFLLANGAECEPLLDKDQVVMTNYPELVLEGMQQVITASSANKGIVAVKSKNNKSIAALKGKISSTDRPVEVFELPDIYPVGDEVVLIYEVLKKVIGPGALPGTVQTQVNNVETLMNIALAVRGQPVTDKFVTISGWVKEPATIKLPVGTTIKKALEMAGGVTESKFEVILNGLMMGDRLTDLDQPVTKTTSAILVLSPKHPVVIHKQKNLAAMIKLARSVCTSCFQCSETCPRRLLGHPVQPHLVMRAVGYNSLPDDVFELREEVAKTYETAGYCVECGVCELVCPMGLSPRIVSAYIKHLLPRAERSELGSVTPLGTREGLKMPTSRLYQKLGISELKDRPLPFREADRGMVKKTRLLLKQGIGMPAVPVVETGQRVNKGEMVANLPKEQLGTALHASIHGKVTIVTAHEIVIEESGETV